jgi:hypothetical protein
VPKSRSRRKPAKKSQPKRRPVVSSTDELVHGHYDAGQIQAPGDKIGGLLLGGHAPDLMVELLPALLWLEHASGHPTNLCVSGCVTLHYAYAALGIEAKPRAVDLVVSNQRTGDRTLYGRPEPHWSGSTFHGHCVLWLPGSQRFIDPTVEQYPEVRKYGLGPICGRIAASLATPQQQAALQRGEMPAGTAIGVERMDLLLLYTTVDERFGDVVMAGSTVVENLAVARTSGWNLASEALVLLGRPDVIDRARRSPHSHVRALLDVLADADAEVDDAGDWRFNLPSDAGTGRAGRRLDELELPELIDSPSQLPRNPISAFLQRLRRRTR